MDIKDDEMFPQRDWLVSLIICVFFTKILSYLYGYTSGYINPFIIIFSWACFIFFSTLFGRMCHEKENLYFFCF